jgi:putative chitinase
VTIVGAGDGEMLPVAGVRITPSMLMSMSIKEKAAICHVLAPALTSELPKHAIDTPLRVAHFLAQAAHETDGWRTLTEYATGDAYDTRVDLGNTAAFDGDGRRYKGRGIFQLTGTANYRKMGQRLGIDLIAFPILAADPDIAVKIACLYWNDRKMSPMADRDDLLACSIAVTGKTRKTGLPNGWADRQACLKSAKRVLGLA